MDDRSFTDAVCHPELTAPVTSLVRWLGKEYNPDA